MTVIFLKVKRCVKLMPACLQEAQTHCAAADVPFASSSPVHHNHIKGIFREVSSLPPPHSFATEPTLPVRVLCRDLSTGCPFMLSLSDITYSLTAHGLSYSHMWGVDVVPEIRISVVHLHANDCI